MVSFCLIISFLSANNSMNYGRIAYFIIINNHIADFNILGFSQNKNIPYLKSIALLESLKSLLGYSILPIPLSANTPIFSLNIFAAQIFLSANAVIKIPPS